MTINNLVTKLAHSNCHPGLQKKHQLSYCVDCNDEYVRGERETVAFKIDGGEVFFIKPPVDNMRKIYHASGDICPIHKRAHDEAKHRRQSQDSINETYAQNLGT